VGDGVVDAGVDDLTVLDNTTDVNLGGTVGGGSGELHHDGGESRCLEVDKVPAGSYTYKPVLQGITCTLGGDSYLHGGASCPAERG